MPEIVGNRPNISSYEQGDRELFWEGDKTGKEDAALQPEAGRSHP